ncbi:MAG: cysteine desulfurase, partial [Paraglaciecola sp.]
SYVLTALGLNDELAHSSIRFTIGRFTTEAEIDHVIGVVRNAIDKLRDMSPLWDIYKDGINLSTVELAHH